VKRVSSTAAGAALTAALMMLRFEPTHVSVTVATPRVIAAPRSGASAGQSGAFHPFLISTASPEVVPCSSNDTGVASRAACDGSLTTTRYVAPPMPARAETIS
jgi:hypothetical protein